MKYTALITTLLELVGLALLVVGIWLAFGLPIALMVAGVLFIALSYVITSRGGRK